MAAPLSFVIVSPARNEAQFIELTLQSVVAQQRTRERVVGADGSRVVGDVRDIRAAGHETCAGKKRSPRLKVK